MKTTIIIHTEDENMLKPLLDQIKNKFDKKQVAISLNCKGYKPWENNEISSEITSYSEYSAYPTEGLPSASVVEMILKSKDGDILILDEKCKNHEIKKGEITDSSSLYFNKKDLLLLNLDSKYQTLKWFFNDVFFQKFKAKPIDDGSQDSKRFNQKSASPLFNEKIIYIDGGLGDHVMALPLLEKIGSTVHVSCKSPFMFEHLPIKGIIPWTDELFGGYSRFVYQYGSSNNSKTIIDAFFDLYGCKREPSDVLKYRGKIELNPEINTSKKIAIICTSAAKIKGLESNKDWREVRWLKLVHELKKRGYFIIQAGTKNDNQIPTVDLKFLDKSIQKLAGLIQGSSLWISVDTFFHHFASSIKPEVGICLTPFYNDHAKHPGVTYIEKDCGKNFLNRKWWLDLQQPERKECMDLIQINDVLEKIDKK